MQEVNVEGLYASVQEALVLFEKGGWKGRVVVVSPPIYRRFFRGKTGYAMGTSIFFLSVQSFSHLRGEFIALWSIKFQFHLYYFSFRSQI